MKAENCMFLKFVFVFPWNLSFFPSNIVLLRMSLLINIWFSSQSVEVLKGHVDTVFFFLSFYFHVSVSGNDPPTRENIFKISTSSSKCQTCYLFFQNINSVDSTPTTAKYYDTILIHRILLKQLHKNMGIRNFM